VRIEINALFKLIIIVIGSSGSKTDQR
jgi:hypothetical protein